MSWKKGESGNAKGRPRKNRTLTSILEKAGNAKRKKDGTPHSAKSLLAELLWEAAVTGRVTFPDAEQATELEADEWIGIVKFIYQHIDGPPKSELDITSGGEKIMVIVDF